MLYKLEQALPALEQVLFEADFPQLSRYRNRMNALMVVGPNERYGLRILWASEDMNDLPRRSVHFRVRCGCPSESLEPDRPVQLKRSVLVKEFNDSRRHAVYCRIACVTKRSMLSSCR